MVEPRPLMIHRAGRPEHATEAELALVHVDSRDVVVLELDDGERLEVDAKELRAALREAA